MYIFAWVAKSLLELTAAVAFIEGAIAFIGGAVTFVGEGGSAVGRLFETARVGVGDVKGVNKRDLR